jgi:hypothetical protein
MPRSEPADLKDEKEQSQQTDKGQHHLKSDEKLFSETQF